MKKTLLTLMLLLGFAVADVGGVTTEEGSTDFTNKINFVTEAGQTNGFIDPETGFDLGTNDVRQGGVIAWSFDPATTTLTFNATVQNPDSNDYAIVGGPGAWTNLASYQNDANFLTNGSPGTGTNLSGYVNDAGFVTNVGEYLVWTYNGPVNETTEFDGYRVVGATGRVDEVWILAAWRGSDGTLLCDVNKGTLSSPFTTQNNNVTMTTIYTTQGNRPSIAGDDANKEDNAFKKVAQPDITAVSAGSVFSVDIDDKGAGDASYIAIVVRIVYE